MIWWSSSSGCMMGRTQGPTNMPQPALLPLSKRVSSLNGHKVMILTSHVVVAFSFRVLFCQHNLYHYSVLPLSGFSLHHPLLLGGYSLSYSFTGKLCVLGPLSGLQVKFCNQSTLGFILYMQIYLLWQHLLLPLLPFILSLVDPRFICWRVLDPNSLRLVGWTAVTDKGDVKV